MISPATSAGPEQEFIVRDVAPCEYPEVHAQLASLHANAKLYLPASSQHDLGRLRTAASLRHAILRVECDVGAGDVKGFPRREERRFPLDRRPAQR